MIQRHFCFIPCILVGKTCSARYSGSKVIAFAVIQVAPRVLCSRPVIGRGLFVLSKGAGSMPFPKDHKYTAEEFFKLTAENDDSKRYELINGEILSQAAPSEIHQIIVMRASNKIDNYILSNKGKCQVMISPFDVVLDDHNLVQPDVIVICDESKRDGKRCNGAPDFIIEVTSSNYGRDYIDKLDLYRKSGVREYWIVDPLYERIMVYFFEKSSSPYIYTFDMSVSVGIYDGKLNINFKELIQQ